MNELVIPGRRSRMPLRQAAGLRPGAAPVPRHLWSTPDTTRTMITLALSKGRIFEEALPLLLRLASPCWTTPKPPEN